MIRIQEHQRVWQHGKLHTCCIPRFNVYVRQVRVGQLAGALPSQLRLVWCGLATVAAMRTSVIAFLALGVTYATAQFPTCESGFSWTFNSLNQSPCEVLSALGEACTGTNFEVDDLTPDENYLGPQAGFTNQCICSSVFYNILSACAFCQGAIVDDWSHYDQNCTTVSISVFPVPIPSGVAVPHWAYMDPTANGINIFNPQLAQSDVGPDSTAIPQPTVTTPTNNPPSSHSKKNNTAAIAGGVAGGVVAIILLVILIFFLRRRKPTNPGEIPFDSDKLAITEAAYSTNGSAVVPSSTGTSVPVPAVYYNPNDPSTFPGQSAEPLLQNVSPNPSPPAHSQNFNPDTLRTNGGVPNYTNIGAISQPNVHRYAGTPEVM